MVFLKGQQPEAFSLSVSSLVMSVHCVSILGAPAFLNGMFWNVKGVHGDESLLESVLLQF